MAERMLVELDEKGEPTELDDVERFLQLRRRLNGIEGRLARVAGQVAFLFWLTIALLILELLGVYLRLR